MAETIYYHALVPSSATSLSVAFLLLYKCVPFLLPYLLEDKKCTKLFPICSKVFPNALCLPIHMWLWTCWDTLYQNCSNEPASNTLEPVNRHFRQTNIVSQTSVMLLS